MMEQALATAALMLAIPVLPQLARGEKPQKILAELGFSNKQLLQQAKQGILLSVISFAVIALEVSAFAAVGVTDTHNVEEALARQPLPVLALVVLLTPLAEEVFFRGFLQKRVGVFLSGAVFAGLHYGFGSVVEVVAAFSIALVLGWYVRENKTLLPAVAAHFLLNAYAVAVVLLGG